MTRFTYHHRGERRGVLVNIDGLMGPVSVILDEGELCYTYLAGYSNAGQGEAAALFVRQGVGALPECHRVRHRSPEGLLRLFLDWIPQPEGSDLREVLAGLLADYLD
jgi:hypothetical protein